MARSLFYGVRMGVGTVIIPADCGVKCSEPQKALWKGFL